MQVKLFNANGKSDKDQYFHRTTEGIVAELRQHAANGLRFAALTVSFDQPGPHNALVWDLDLAE